FVWGIGNHYKSITRGCLFILKVKKNTKVKMNFEIKIAKISNLWKNPKICYARVSLIMNPNGFVDIDC
ncbi:hypothetical protein, partial [Helicobacter pullorum]|uniref:hypothetical protein n=1 Tax=Helicobacter pullorum TaxID=35818 RepID=UPI001C527BCB